MENTIGTRIRQLRLHYRLSVKEFAAKSDLSHVAIFHLEKGKTLKPHRGSLIPIVKTFQTSIDWLLFGKGEMLPNGDADLNEKPNEALDYWKTEAFEELKNKNEILQSEIERLWVLVNYFTNIQKNDLSQPLKEIIRNAY